MLGRTISHYRITAQLGAGGMGVVYAGEDVRLGRPVAAQVRPGRFGGPPRPPAASRRSTRRFGAEPPEYLHDLRRRRARGPTVPRDGAAQGADPARAADAWADQDPSGGRPRHPGRRCARCGARRRHSPSRRQARQSLPDGSRHRQDPGFRPREARTGRTRRQSLGHDGSLDDRARASDRRRRHRRHGFVYVPRAGHR